MGPSNYQSILSNLVPPIPQKRKVFISYHHADQIWIDNFRNLFDGIYNIFTDCSLDQAMESNDLTYVHRTIREEYITGTSVTIVICGTETANRKCVDWEIYSTLDKNHALLGIALPHNRELRNGEQIRIVPDRLLANVNSGYATWIDWTDSPQLVKYAIEKAIELSNTNRVFKNNSASRMQRNR